MSILGTVGSLVGTYFCPGLGTIAGNMAGEALDNVVTGDKNTPKSQQTCAQVFSPLNFFTGGVSGTIASVLDMLA